MDTLEKPRWTVEIIYSTDAGFTVVDHTIHELVDLHDIVERGPNFYAIESITIRVSDGYADLRTTVEEDTRS